MGRVRRLRCDHVDDCASSCNHVVSGRLLPAPAGREARALLGEYWRARLGKGGHARVSDLVVAEAELLEPHHPDALKGSRTNRGVELKVLKTDLPYIICWASLRYAVPRPLPQ